MKGRVHLIRVVVLFLLAAGVARGDEPRTYLNRTAASWAQDLNHTDARHRRAAAFALGQLGTAGLPHLHALTQLLHQDKDPAVRSAVAAALAELGTLSAGKVMPALVQALEKDAEPAVRRAAAQAVGRLGDRAASAQAALTRALRAEDAGLRQTAAWALGQLGSAAAPAVPALTAALTDTDPTVRRHAGAALGNLGSDAVESVSALTTALGDPDPAVREAVVLALRQFGPLAFASAGALMALAESPTEPPGLRQAAVGTVEQVWPTGQKANALWDRLTRLAEHGPASGIRIQAQEALRKVAPRRRD